MEFYYTLNEKKWSLQYLELIIYFWMYKNVQISKQHKARELDMITLRNYAPRWYMTWLPVSLSVINMIIV